MDSGIQVRPAVEQDAPAMARVHVDSWRQTYRGLMADTVLDDPDLLDQRGKFWAAVLTDPRYSMQRVAVAEHESELVGIAMAGPSREPDVDWLEQLFVLYTYAAIHGRGAGAALLDAVVEPTSVVGLWVADPNPRAQAFYRKHGFLPDGACSAEDGIDEIRMVRH
ncbi:GNAT family N-acetyltransferase [Allobranchiibius sp. CTAmp26]|uniref:GNAT family N-acetyltransferase n=1 Tax=Allobranchiibius sp. CTAmp26 TaxID=2815214 RepID=UPI0027DDB16B|nr:GNAT family N-acetyltransferase [Allobranchiibius sp. CTAmp26]